jgi:hypothetical protein
MSPASCRKHRYGRQALGRGGHFALIETQIPTPPRAGTMTPLASNAIAYASNLIFHDCFSLDISFTII